MGEKSYGFILASRMPPTPIQTNTPVLLEQARRYVDAESERITGLQTRTAALLAAIVVLVGLALTVESQFSNRSIPQWIAVVVGLLALAALLAGAASCVGVLSHARVDREAPSTISVLLAPGVAETDPVLLNRQLITTLDGELETARAEGLRIEAALRLSTRWLAGGVLALFVLAGLFGATHEQRTTQNVKILGSVHAKLAAPIQTRVVAPVHAVVAGSLRARITAPVTLVLPAKHRWHRR